MIRWLLRLFEPPSRPGPQEGEVRVDWGDNATVYRWDDEKREWVRI